jgi:hypothetical protein
MGGFEAPFYCIGIIGIEIPKHWAPRWCALKAGVRLMSAMLCAKHPSFSPISSKRFLITMALTLLEAQKHAKTPQELAVVTELAAGQLMSVSLSATSKATVFSGSVKRVFPMWDSVTTTRSC